MDGLTRCLVLIYVFNVLLVKNIWTEKSPKSQTLPV